MSQASPIIGEIRPGQQVGNWTVLSTGEILSTGTKEIRFKPACLVRCTCGRERIVRESALTSGRSRSCGAGVCSGAIGPKAGAYRHGQNKRQGYNSWVNMIRRCEDPESPDFHLYGGRGIRVFSQWRRSPKAFIDDMGPRPHGTTLDRIDVNGNYEPGNCRWADDLTQGRNRRNTHRVEIAGREMYVVEACAITGISPGTARMRIWRGWDPLRAVTQPLR